MTRLVLALEHGPPPFCEYAIAVQPVRLVVSALGIANVHNDGLQTEDGTHKRNEFVEVYGLCCLLFQAPLGLESKQKRVGEHSELN